MKQNILPLLTVTIVLLINIVAGWHNEFDKKLQKSCGGKILNKWKSEFKWDYGDRRSELGCTDLPGVTPIDDIYCLMFDSRTGKHSVPLSYEFQKNWKFSCPRGIITGITSVHKGGSWLSYIEDRVFAFRCCQAHSVAKDNKNCKWTDWQNNYKGKLDYTTPDKHFIKGVESVFDKGAYDRRFKFEICSIE